MSSNKNTGGFVWMSFSDLSTGLMMSFILILMYFMNDSQRLKEEVEKDLKVKSIIESVFKDTTIIINKDLSKYCPGVKEFKWDGKRAAIQVVFENDQDSSWFRNGSEYIKSSKQACVKKFSSIIFPMLYEKLGNEHRAEFSRFVIEGHTNSIKYDCKDIYGKNDYECNLWLSQGRSLETSKLMIRAIASKGDIYSWAKKVISATGRSSSDLLLDTNGKEDINLSKRVEFRYVQRSKLEEYEDIK